MHSDAIGYGENTKVAALAGVGFRGKFLLSARRVRLKGLDSFIRDEPTLEFKDNISALGKSDEHERAYLKIGATLGAPRSQSRDTIDSSNRFHASDFNGPPTGVAYGQTARQTESASVTSDDVFRRLVKQRTPPGAFGGYPARLDKRRGRAVTTVEMAPARKGKRKSGKSLGGANREIAGRTYAGLRVVDLNGRIRQERRSKNVSARWLPRRAVSLPSPIRDHEPEKRSGIRDKHVRI
ncbi:hypothetical protein KM043_004190 [Ampulex compressa]|nr:hypothetical protein KM043_004190 [Ampulex compressa]